MTKSIRKRNKPSGDHLLCRKIFNFLLQFSLVPHFKAIQNEMQIHHEKIRTEIRNAFFVTVMSDDTTDVSEQAQLVLALPYVLNGNIFESFWRFFIAENQTADSISKRTLEQLDIILQGYGLIA